MDAISLKGMLFYGYHGVLPEERTLGQRFTVDVEVEADLRRAGETDQLEHTINYSHIFRITKEVVEETHKNLIEAIAESIAAKILSTLPVAAVRVRVSKTSPPIKGAVLESASVSIHRTHSSLRPEDR